MPEVDLRRLHPEETGAGDPILLISGLERDTLAPRRVITHDHRGPGASSRGWQRASAISAAAAPAGAAAVFKYAFRCEIAFGSA